MTITTAQGQQNIKYVGAAEFHQNKLQSIFHEEGRVIYGQQLDETDKNPYLGYV